MPSRLKHLLITLKIQVKCMYKFSYDITCLQACTIYHIPVYHICDFYIPVAVTSIFPIGMFSEEARLESQNRDYKLYLHFIQESFLMRKHWGLFINHSSVIRSCSIILRVLRKSVTQRTSGYKAFNIITRPTVGECFVTDK